MLAYIRIYLLKVRQGSAGFYSMYNSNLSAGVNLFGLRNNTGTISSLLYYPP